MSRPPIPALAAAGLSFMALAGLAAGACTDTELRCIAADCQVQEKALTDNVVHAQGKVCTRDPNTASYPYKIILVIDTSGSTQKSDPTAINGRWKAVQEVLTDPNYINNPHIQFAVVRFATDPIVLQAAFTADRALLQNAVASLYDAHNTGDNTGSLYQDYQTDYLKALLAVEKIITDDAAAAPPGERAYTQYDVQWLSDGNPEKNPDCPNCGITDPGLIEHCSETIPIVLAETANLADLKGKLGVFSVKFSAIFLDAQPAYNSICSLYYGDPTRWGPGPSYLKPMVNLFVPRGSYQELSADKLAFDIQVNTITRRYQQNSFFLVNYSRVVDGNALLPDSDQDGISDNDESKNGTKPTTAHSDPKTLCSDMTRLRSADNPDVCFNTCTPGATGTLAGVATTLDQDGDGLLTCEESALVSTATLIDTDKDDLTDDIETRFGTSPLQATNVKGLDFDRDGIDDIDEIFMGLNPLNPQPDKSLAYTYVPLQTATGDANSGVSCYTFQVDNVQLAPTQASETSGLGDNKVCLFLVQHTVDNPYGQPTISRACKTANLQLDPNGLAIKTPANGVLQFDGGEFSVVMCPDPNSCPAAASGVTLANPLNGTTNTAKTAADITSSDASEAAAPFSPSASERAVLRQEEEKGEG